MLKWILQGEIKNFWYVKKQKTLQKDIFTITIILVEIFWSLSSFRNATTSTTTKQLLTRIEYIYIYITSRKRFPHTLTKWSLINYCCTENNTILVMMWRTDIPIVTHNCLLHKNHLSLAYVIFRHRYMFLMSLTAAGEYICSLFKINLITLVHPNPISTPPTKTSLNERKINMAKHAYIITKCISVIYIYIYMPIIICTATLKTSLNKTRGNLGSDKIIQNCFPLSLQLNKMIIRDKAALYVYV